MHESKDTFTRFERRFRGIEELVPDRPFVALGLHRRRGPRLAYLSLAVGAAILVV